MLKGIALVVVLSTLVTVPSRAEVTRAGRRGISFFYRLHADVEVRTDLGSEFLHGRVERFSFSYFLPLTVGVVACAVTLLHANPMNFLQNWDWRIMVPAFLASEAMVMAFNAWGGPLAFIEKGGDDDPDRKHLIRTPALRARFNNVLSARPNQQKGAGDGEYRAYAPQRLKLVVDAKYNLISGKLIAEGIEPIYPGASLENVELDLSEIHPAEKALQPQWK